MVRQAELQIIDMEVQTGEDDANGGVEGGARGNGGVVGGGHVAAEGRVGAADVGDGFGGELGFDAGFAEDVDGVVASGEGEDAGDVDCGAVGGAEDFFLFEGVRGWVWKGGGEGGGPRRRECPCFRASFCSRRGIWCCCLWRRRCVCLVSWSVEG